MSKKKGLSQAINNIKKDINNGFSTLEKRVSALEASDKVNSIEIRDIKIKLAHLSGTKQIDIANLYDITPSRVNQIIKKQ